MATSSASSKTASAEDDSESITRATMVDVFGAITLLNPTWSIIRHPFRFTRFRTSPGNAVHYLYASLGVVLIVTGWTDPPGRVNDGGDAAPFVELINRVIAGLGPNARLEGGDGLPAFLLAGNIIGGITAYLVCRWLARRQGVIGPRDPLAGASDGAQTLAANAYICGAMGIVYAIGLLLSRGNPDSPLLDAAMIVILFLLFSWGRWLQAIHGLRFGRVAGAMFPFALAFASLGVFAGVDAALRQLLRL
jgi:hypothetical protein